MNDTAAAIMTALICGMVMGALIMHNFQVASRHKEALNARRKHEM